MFAFCSKIVPFVFIIFAKVVSHERFKDRRYSWTTNVCNLPLSIGYGIHTLPRWYYNNFESKCEFFYYRGCCGNRNNFLTCKECQSVCEADSCSQRKNAGYGSKRITRYYYDESSKICLSFVYFGLGGNRNNFMTLNECRETCAEIAPCIKNDPLFEETGKMLHCTSTDDACPKNYFCQLGSTYTNSYCCPKSKQSPCSQTLSKGHGTETIPRWYFDPTLKQCLQFLFSGVQANENNFLTQQECELNCLIICPQGKPYSNGGWIVNCYGQFKQCPNHYYCHSGSDLDSSICCYSESSNFCTLPADSGTGSDSLSRWYYDSKTGKCLKFIYGGLSGNANNFLTKEFCEDYCEGSTSSTTTIFYSSSTSSAMNPSTSSTSATSSSSATSSTSSPTTTMSTSTSTTITSASTSTTVSTSTPTTSSTISTISTISTSTTQTSIATCAFGQEGISCSENFSVCPFPYFCNIGSNTETTVCCPKSGNLENPCLQQLNGGVGTADLQRWYFDVATRQCLQFSYKGLQGNENNFLTSTDCENSCLICGQGSVYWLNGQMFKCSTSGTNICPPNYFCHIGFDIQTTACCPSPGGNLCLLPADQGRGSANLPRWFFDDTSNICLGFTFRGLGGNENNFQSKMDCETRCLKSTTTSTVATTTTSQLQFMCDQDVDMGVGNDNILRYYYNKNIYQCEGFNYRGSGGNKNNFPKIDDCISNCLNPCAGNPPGKNASNNLIFCQNSDGCPTNHWCHLGATPQTRLCCPGSNNPCNLLQPAPGTGPYSLIRYFYNPTTNECEQFIYNGLNGNQNNFESLADCESRCQTKRQIRV